MDSQKSRTNVQNWFFVTVKATGQAERKAAHLWCMENVGTENFRNTIFEHDLVPFHGPEFIFYRKEDVTAFKLRFQCSR